MSEEIEKDNDGNFTALFLYHYANPVDCFVIFGSKPSIDDISHEATHISNFILKVCDIKTTQDKDESLAYLIGNITQKIYDKIYK